MTTGSDPLNEASGGGLRPRTAQFHGCHRPVWTSDTAGVSDLHKPGPLAGPTWDGRSRTFSRTAATRLARAFRDSGWVL